MEYILFRPTDQRAKQVEVLKKEAADYDFVRFTWPDLHGICRGKYVQRDHVPENIQHGIGVFAGHIALGPHCEVSMPPSVPQSLGNCYYRPVPGTLRAVPWCGGEKRNVGQVICESVWPDGSALKANPRFVARKQLMQLDKLGYTLKSSWEAEFFVYDMKTKRPVFDHPDDLSLFAVFPYEEMFMSATEQLLKAGIGVEKFNAEYGLGQFEVCLNLEPGIAAADNMFFFKEAMKEIFFKQDLLVSFMTIPFPKCGSNGAHFNHSLWSSSGKNLFFDAKSENGVSELAKQWTAGIVKHAPALTILQSPTVNCFRRLHQILTPDKADWGMDNRNATARLKSISMNQTYLENRLPSGASNPYIVMAATIAAGLDGLLNKLQLPPEKDPEAEAMPYTMEEAVTTLEDDSVIVEALGAEFIEWFLTEKKSVEVAAFKDHDMSEELPAELEKERDMYFKYM